jgi:cell division protein FtsQ
MKQWQKIVIRVLWSLSAAALIVLFVVSWKAKSQKKLRDIQVELVGESAQALFMDEISIRAILNEQGVHVGLPLEQLNLTELERFIEKKEWVKNAEFFVDNKLVLEAKIEQRIPIARVFTSNGASFYIDNEGSRLPLKQLTVLNLPVFTGFPTDQPKLSKPDSILLKDVLTFAKTIQKDSFFMAQVAQVNIEPNGHFQMVPTLGDHLVLLGTIDKLEDKLNRLFTFYKKVWVGSGINSYQVIDCRFDQQVVALKKGLQPIEFSGNFIWPTGDSTLPMPPAVEKVDSTVKSAPAVVVPAVVPVAKAVEAPKATVVAVKKTTVKTPPAKNIKVKTVAPKTKSKVQSKAVKSKAKLNNKPKNNSLDKKNKTAKAIMPKKSKSPTKNN